MAQSNVSDKQAKSCLNSVSDPQNVRDPIVARKSIQSETDTLSRKLFEIL